MIEGTVLCPQDFGVSVCSFFVFKFEIVLNYFFFFVYDNKLIII